MCFLERWPLVPLVRREMGLVAPLASWAARTLTADGIASSELGGDDMGQRECEGHEGGHHALGSRDHARLEACSLRNSSEGATWADCPSDAEFWSAVHRAFTLASASEVRRAVGFEVVDQSGGNLERWDPERWNPKRRDPERSAPQTGSYAHPAHPMLGRASCTMDP